MMIALSVLAKARGCRLKGQEQTKQLQLQRLVDVEVGVDEGDEQWKHRNGEKYTHTHTDT